MTWVKDRVGQSPKKTKFCIIATHGSPKFNNKKLMWVIEAPARQYGRKPDELYEMVAAACPGRRLDYFSHEKRDGWEQFGLDCDRFNDET